MYWNIPIFDYSYMLVTTACVSIAVIFIIIPIVLPLLVVSIPPVTSIIVSPIITVVGMAGMATGCQDRPCLATTVAALTTSSPVSLVRSLQDFVIIFVTGVLAIIGTVWGSLLPAPASNLVRPYMNPQCIINLSHGYRDFTPDALLTEPVFNYACRHYT